MTAWAAWASSVSRIITAGCLPWDFPQAKPWEAQGACTKTYICKHTRVKTWENKEDAGRGKKTHEKKLKIIPKISQVLIKTCKSWEPQARADYY